MLTDVKCFPQPQPDVRRLQIQPRRLPARTLRQLPEAEQGGERQRGAIARALINDPPLLVADEPTGNLDSSTSEDIFQLFLSLVARGKTMVMVTHSLDLAVRGSRVVEIRDGRITNDVPAAQHPRARARNGAQAVVSGQWAADSQPVNH